MLCAEKNLPVRIVERKHGTNRFRTVLYRLHLRKVFLKKTIGRVRLETPPKMETTENREKTEEETYFFINLGKPLCVGAASGSNYCTQDENVGDSDRFPLKKDFKLTILLPQYVSRIFSLHSFIFSPLLAALYGKQPSAYYYYYSWKLPVIWTPPPWREGRGGRGIRARNRFRFERTKTRRNSSTCNSPKNEFLGYGLREHIFLFWIRENAFCLGGALLDFRWALSLCIAIWPHSTQEKVWISTKLPSLPFPTKVSFEIAKPPPIPTPFLERADTRKANRLVTLSFSRNPSKSQFFFWEASGWMNRNLLASLLFLGEAAAPFYGSVKSPPRGVLDLGLLPPETHDHSFPATSDDRGKEAKIGHGTLGN